MMVSHKGTEATKERLLWFGSGSLLEVQLQMMCGLRAGRRKSDREMLVNWLSFVGGVLLFGILLVLAARSI